MSFKTIICSSASLISLMAAAPAVAQESAGGVSSVDDIIVTARRRDERQQDVPLAVTALSGAALERANITNVSALQGSVPSLTLIPNQTAGTTTPVFAIRGLSQQEFTGLADPSVSLYINDMVIPRTQGSNVGFFDMQSVQVLRGPQGTLFGRNTPGGAVVVTTRRPVQEFEASVQQTVGSRDTLETEGYINVPVGPDAALRIAGSHTQTDGYITDDVTGKKVNFENHDALRVSFLVNSGALESLFIADYTDVDDGFPTAYARPGSLGGADQAARGYYHTASGIPVFTRIKTFNITNRTSVELNDNLTLRNIIGYREMKYNQLLDSDGSALFVLPIGRIAEQNQVSEELQLLGTHGWGNWIAGAYLFNETVDDQGVSTGSFGGCAIPQDFTLRDNRRYSCFANTWSIAENTSKAVFAQATVNLGIEGLTATIGGRMNWDNRKADIRNRRNASCRFTLDADGNPATPEVPRTLDNCSLLLDRNFSEPTYNVSLEYKPSRDFLVYAAHRHGYRTGGFGARASTEAGLRRNFKPEKVDDFELGVKADWHLGDVFARTNLAVFYNNYKDIQRLLTDQTTLPVTTVTFNAQKARIKGLEFEGLLRPASWLELSGFYSYTKTKFVKFLDFSGNDLSGNPFARAPKHLAGATLRVMAPLGSLGEEGSLALRYSHISKHTNNDDFIRGVSEQEGYDLLHLTGDIKSVAGTGFDLSAYVNNLLDKKYSYGGMGLGLTTINSRIAAEPRTIGMRVRYTFR
jgi:iron complex outermembrane receptor protein